MRKISVYNFISLNGCFSGPHGDLSWHRHGGEEAEFASQNASSGNALLFGRITFEMMAGYWPTAMAKQNAPEIAKGMNDAEKIVFSRTLSASAWANSRVISGNLEEEVKKLKAQSGSDLTILGSGSIVSQLANFNLIDSYQIMIDPVVVSGGRPFLYDLHKNLNLKLVDTRTFKSGVILANYVPV